MSEQSEGMYFLANEAVTADQSPEAIAKEVLEATLHLGYLTMQFAQVKRATGDLHANPESDTDHTVMLSFTAVALAEHDPRLDPGKVAIYALIHDFVEVYAGDTSTIFRHQVDKAAKKQREAEALQRLKAELGGTFPQFISYIETYEHCEENNDINATFVKTLDKSTPAITHLFNDGSTIDDKISDVTQLRRSSLEHTKELAATYGQNHPMLISLRQLISTRMADEFEQRQSERATHPTKNENDPLTRRQRINQVARKGRRTFAKLIYNFENEKNTAA